MRRADVFKLRRRLIKPRSRSEGVIELLRRDALIEWEKTKAFALSGPFFGRIYLNTVGREPQGTVSPGAEWEALREQIAERLLTLRDPATGRPVIEHVWRREEIYQGPRADELPDLVVKPADGYQVTTEFRRGLLVEPMPGFLTGTHRMEGILVLHGPGICSGVTVEGASIADLAPTILHLMGLPVPENMDGRVLLDALTEEARAARPVHYIAAEDEEEPGGPTGDVYSDADSAEVEARLAGLGYLS